MEVEEVATNIVDAAIKVHRALGPGLLESAYQFCLAYELRKRGLRVECEVLLPIAYDGQELDAGYRIDMLVEGCIIVENKVADALLPVHEAQLLSYLRLRGLRLGFLLNWNVRLMKQGIQRMINDPRRWGRNVNHKGQEEHKGLTNDCYDTLLGDASVCFAPFVVGVPAMKQDRVRASWESR